MSTKFQPHIRSKPRRDKLADRFRNAADPFRIAIVRNMWLTGLDAPCLHTRGRSGKSARADP
jgi:type I restriction enzyme, R subunit